MSSSGGFGFFSLLSDVTVMILPKYNRNIYTSKTNNQKLMQQKLYYSAFVFLECLILGSLLCILSLKKGTECSPAPSYYKFNTTEQDWNKNCSHNAGFLEHLVVRAVPVVNIS